MSLAEGDDVQQLLLAAADRLPTGAGTTVALPRKDAPKASEILVAKHGPYVHSNGSVAQLDRERLVRLAKASTSSAVHQVGDPICRTKEPKVRIHPIRRPYLFLHEETIPISMR